MDDVDVDVDVDGSFFSSRSSDDDGESQLEFLGTLFLSAARHL